MILVMGLGFVGLTTALGFSEKGYKVFGYDIDIERIDTIKRGQIPFHEPGLDKALKKNLHKNFFISKDILNDVKQSEFIFYCVGTPQNEDGSADISYILTSINQTLECMNKSQYKVLVIKSTVPPSTTLERVKPFIESKGFIVGKEVGLANNPEFLREGYAWEDFMNPDRVVLGASDDRSSSMLRNLYQPFQVPVHTVSLNAGEFIKYMSNTLLATMISFANEMSVIADVIGDINVIEAFKILHEDRRWFGHPAGMISYVYPGCGYGGYCLPKDTHALYKEILNRGFDACILKHVMETNYTIKEYVVQKIVKKVAKEDTIGILGLSFKPLSDDVRESPSKAIIELLINRGYKNIIAYDPMSMDIFSKSYNLRIGYAKSLADIIKKADKLVILTAWPEFKQYRDQIAQKLLYDFRYYIHKDKQAT